MRRLWAAGGRPRGYGLGVAVDVFPRGKAEIYGSWDGTILALGDAGTVRGFAQCRGVGGDLGTGIGWTSDLWLPGVTGTADHELEWLRGILWADRAEVWADGGALYRSAVTLRGVEWQRSRLIERGNSPARIVHIR